MSEAGPQSIGKGPRAGRLRSCVVTRAVRPEAELIRFVAAPDGSVVADIRSRLPGRGVWVWATRAEVAEAARRKLFARSLKAPVTAPADLAESVGARLRDAALGRLGLARKAGAAAAGFAKVEAAIGREPVAALLTASDAAEDGRRKLAGAVRRRFGDAAGPLEIALFDGAELSLAMGLPNVIHAAVLQSPAGKSFVEAANRLLRYEGLGGSASTSTAGDPPHTADDPQDETNG